MSLDRYSRQTSLPEMGIAGQSRLLNSRVTCVGMGGLGSPIALYLAAAGVGTLHLMDDDCVDQTNLQRQIIFREKDEGLKKVIACKNHLQALNSSIRIDVTPERLTALNALEALKNSDLIIDGSDNFETRFAMNDAACTLGIPWLFGAIDRFDAQVALFNGRNGPCYRCLFSAEPTQPIRNCRENGVLGPRVGVVGTLQSTLALNYLISRDQPDHPLSPQFGQLMVLRFSKGLSMTTVQIQKRENCPSCSMTNPNAGKGRGL